MGEDSMDSFRSNQVLASFRGHETVDVLGHA